MGVGISPNLGSLFLLLDFLVQPQYEGFCHVLLYLVICASWLTVLLGACSVLKGKQKEMDLGKRGGGGELRGDEGEEM